MTPKELGELSHLADAAPKVAKTGATAAAGVPVLARTTTVNAKSKPSVNRSPSTWHPSEARSTTRATAASRSVSAMRMSVASSTRQRRWLQLPWACASGAPVGSRC